MNTLTLLSWAIAAGGLLCFLIWNKLISDADKLRELKRFRSRKPASPICSTMRQWSMTG